MFKNPSDPTRYLVSYNSSYTGSLRNMILEKKNGRTTLRALRSGENLSDFSTYIYSENVIDLLSFGTLVPVKSYVSATKGVVSISRMQPQHLVNAIKKKRRNGETGDTEYQDLLLEAGKRGLSLS